MCYVNLVIQPLAPFLNQVYEATPRICQLARLWKAGLRYLTSTLSDVFAQSLEYAGLLLLRHFDIVSVWRLLEVHMDASFKRLLYLSVFSYVEISNF